MANHHSSLDQHKRTRSNNTKIKHNFPSKNKFVSRLDNICLLFSVIMPLTAIPQIYKIFAEKTAAGLSLTSWTLYCVAVIPFMLYGIVHKEKPIIILNAMWLVVQIIIITGILIYR